MRIQRIYTDWSDYLETYISRVRVIIWNFTKLQILLSCWKQKYKIYINNNSTCVCIKLIYDNLKITCVCALTFDNINYYRNFIEYRHESVGVWGVIAAQMVWQYNTIQYSLGISIVLSNGMSNSIVHRERLTPVEQIFNQGM